MSRKIAALLNFFKRKNARPMPDPSLPSHHMTSTTVEPRGRTTNSVVVISALPKSTVAGVPKTFTTSWTHGFGRSDSAPEVEVLLGGELRPKVPAGEDEAAGADLPRHRTKRGSGRRSG